MRKIALALVVPALLLWSLTGAAAESKLYKGRLNAALSGASTSFTLTMRAATPEEKAALPGAPGNNAEVLTTRLSTGPVFLVVPESGERGLVWFEGKAGGGYKKGSIDRNGVADISVPVSLGIYNELPVRLVFLRPEGMPPLLNVQLSDIATGEVEIDGKQIKVQYSLDPRQVRLDPVRGKVAVDCNGNGRIDPFPSNEEANPNGKPVLFHVGSHYLATKSVDVNTGEIIMEERPSSEYTRIDLTVGNEVPNFSFKDLKGRTHHLSDFKGKYLLLNFWGSW